VIGKELLTHIAPLHPSIISFQLIGDEFLSACSSLSINEAATFILTVSRV
jgi:hypothetical protein